MMVPVRCFTCGNVVGQYWDTYRERTARGEKPRKVLDELGLTRYCCRRMMLSHVDLLDDVGPYG
ncbi:RNA polymerase, N/8 Kd subunit [mine drainage metagenome]|uniref:RNA polymerase, N/8 Kd subunit n=1 Tax=mine drainage metagenome TaxID=410659 RepID=T0ZHT6_9ZZZZ